VLKHRVRSIGILAAVLALAACAGGEEAPAPESPAPATTAESGGSPEAASQGASGARTLPVPGGGSEGGELPPGHPPIGDTSQLPQVDPGGDDSLGWTVPESWVVEQPSSSMRKAQYRAPGPDGDAQCVVFYFGPGQGGDPQANAMRWAGQFKQPDGSSSASVMKTSTLKDAAGRDVLYVEVTGTYDGGMTMTMEPSEPQAGYMLLGGVAQGPDAPWFFKFTGPEATVRSHREAFEGMLQSVK
jgi:hypothetical protein